MANGLQTILAGAALTAALCGCANEPLVGQWKAATTQGTFRFATTLTLASDYSVTVIDSGTGSCSGARTYTGVTWSSSSTDSASTVTFSGVPACRGAIACTMDGATVTLGCPTDAARMTGACSYSLSSDTNTLTLIDCSGHSGTSTTYTRTSP